MCKLIHPQHRNTIMRQAIVVTPFYFKCEGCGKVIESKATMILFLSGPLAGKEVVNNPMPTRCVDCHSYRFSSVDVEAYRAYTLSLIDEDKSLGA